jgi:8-oxo-dGTP pyrophosphatase MutT (NUDIX family)
MTAASDLLDRLARHSPSDEREAQSLTRMSRLLVEAPRPFSRAQPEGHVTGSAMVLGPDGRALLLFHARLSLWVQPGGHVEEDEGPEEAALREAREETGLSDLTPVLGEDGRPLLLDVDVHPIPASEKRGEPAHHHHDCCLLLTTRRPESARHDPTESRSLRWVDATEAATLPLDPATIRRLQKAFRLAGRATAAGPR